MNVTTARGVGVDNALLRGGEVYLDSSFNVSRGPYLYADVFSDRDVLGVRNHSCVVWLGGLRSVSVGDMGQLDWVDPLHDFGGKNCTADVPLMRYRGRMLVDDWGLK
jgi:hypothetical protein